MNGSTMPLWPSLLPPVCDQLWFTADFPKNEEAELAALEDELEQEKLLLKEQSRTFKIFLNFRAHFLSFKILILLSWNGMDKHGALKCRTSRRRRRL
jgi:hypothetical protein